ncbi:MAG: hypothetical protein KatS3mg087_1855 [Patescibacteria group bacterium]|nr:MAG: hypothetical protein KatS3mg087_1855 [Patescibacteria group bacterium]
MARTTLRQENGKRIAVIPAASVDDEPSLAQVASGSCLAAMDFDEWCKNGTDIGETVTSYGFDFSDPAKAYSTREVRVWLAYFYSAKNHKVIRGGYCGSSKKWLRANTIALDSMAL